MNSTKRFEVWLINLDPTVGSEIKKTRPCVILSPDVMNRHLRTVIVGPLTSKPRSFPSRIPIKFQGKVGEIALDQLRTVDQSRLIKRLGAINEKESVEASRCLIEMFEI